MAKDWAQQDCSEGRDWARGEVWIEEGGGQLSPARTAWPRAEIQPPALTDVYTLLAKCVVGFQSAQGKGKFSLIGLPRGDAFF